MISKKTREPQTVSLIGRFHYKAICFDIYGLGRAHVLVLHAENGVLQQAMEIFEADNSERGLELHSQFMENLSEQNLNR